MAMRSKQFWISISALVLVGCAPPAPEAPPPVTSTAPAPQAATVYERFAQLEGDAAFQAKLAAPAARINDMVWMIGTWRTTIAIEGGEPEAADNTTFRRQGDALIVSDDLSTVLGYDGFAQRWFSAGFEPPAAPMTQSFSSADWDGAHLVLDADVMIFGERFVLRQTMTKISDDEFEIVNEQLVGPGQYRVADRYHYARVPSSR